MYALSNPAMPGLIKIGKTCRSTVSRINELFQTGVPLPFVVEFEIASPDCLDLERRIHSELVACRVNDGREFFAVGVDEVREKLTCHLRDQMDELVAAFMPDHMIIESGEFVCPSSVSQAAHHCGLEPQDMSWVFEFLKKDDLAGAIDRCAKRHPIFRRRLDEVRGVDRGVH